MGLPERRPKHGPETGPRNAQIAPGRLTRLA